jgi:hypothetical protein
MNETNSFSSEEEVPRKPGKGRIRRVQPSKSLNNYRENRAKPTKPPTQKFFPTDFGIASREAIKGKYKITIVLLTWQRLSSLKNMLVSLSNQTYKNFDVRISNANLVKFQYIENVAKMFDGHLDITVSHDGNDVFAFRRLTVGKDLAESGTNIILFIDDDVQIPNNYIEQCLRQYEEKSYKSGFAWRIDRGGSDYYKYRTRIHDPNEKVHYCGTGMSMIDASIFLDPRLIGNAPPEAIRVEDLWMSYFAQRVLRWKLAAMPLQNVQLGGADQVALYKRILKEKYTENLPDKSDFMRLLVRKYKWKL